MHHRAPEEANPGLAAAWLWLRTPPRLTVCEGETAQSEEAGLQGGLQSVAHYH